MIAPVSCVQCTEPLYQSPNNGFLHDVCALAWITANPAPKRTSVQPTEPQVEADRLEKALVTALVVGRKLEAELAGAYALLRNSQGETAEVRAALMLSKLHPAADQQFVQDLNDEIAKLKAALARVTIAQTSALPPPAESTRPLPE